MDNENFIEFNHIRNFINIEPTFFSIYIKELFNDLTDYDENEVEKGISKTTFTDYFRLPSLINNKLYKVFDKKNTGYVNFKDFNNKMTKLYLGTYEETTNIIFDIYDFDNDGIIKKEDVRLILSFLPLKNKENSCKFKEQLESLEEINQILNDTFGSNNDNLNYEQFLNVIEKIRSDFYVQLLCFLYHKKPFEDTTINLIKNTKKKYEPINTGAHNKRSNLNLVKNENKETKNRAKVSPSKKTKFVSTEQIITLENHIHENKNIFNFNHLDDNDSNNNNSEDSYSKNYHHRELESNKTSIGFKIKLRQGANESPEQELESEVKRDMKKKLTIKEHSHLNPFELKSHEKPLTSRIEKISNNLNELKIDSKNNSSKIIMKNNSTKDSSSESSSISPNKNMKGKIVAYSNNSVTKFDNENFENNNYDSNFINKVHYEDWVFIKEKDGKLKKCYLILNGSELSIYRTEKKCELVAIQHISGFFIKDGNSETKLIDKEKYFYFVLFHSKDKSKYYYCNNINSKNKWIQNIKLAIGLYEITDYYDYTGDLGQGLFGVVKKAIDKKTKETVAIKIIAKNKLQPGEIYLIRNEVELLKHFHHPNIVRIHNSFETFENIYIVMEFLPGGDLLEFMESRLEVPEKTISNIMHCIASVIKYLNSYGVIHRDIKPENIMLLEKIDNPTIKLIDFGLTRIIAQGEKLCEGFGTISYVAPEVLLRKPYNKQIDIWSMGVIMYFLLSNGKLPFDDSTDDGIAKKALLADPAYPDELFGKRSKSSILLVNECLVKDPEKRITIDGYLKHRWFSQKF